MAWWYDENPPHWSVEEHEQQKREHDGEEAAAAAPGQDDDEQRQAGAMPQPERVEQDDDDEHPWWYSEKPSDWDQDFYNVKKSEYDDQSLAVDCDITVDDLHNASFNHLTPDLPFSRPTTSTAALSSVATRKLWRRIEQITEATEAGTGPTPAPGFGPLYLDELLQKATEHWETTLSVDPDAGTPVQFVKRVRNQLGEYKPSVSETE